MAGGITRGNTDGGREYVLEDDGDGGVTLTVAWSEHCAARWEIAVCKCGDILVRGLNSTSAGVCEDGVGIYPTDKSTVGLSTL